MELETSGRRPRVFRCGRRRRESNPLFRAALSNNLNEFIALVEAGNPINIQSLKGSSLLNFIMRRKRVEIFNYLLTRPDLDVNYKDRFQQSPLLYLAGVCYDEHFALELLKKGADIRATDDSGFTFLHLAAKSEGDETLDVGRMVIEKGADVDARGRYGITPLYAACEVGNLDWICMLLYYGADATIANIRGVLPIAALSEDIPQDSRLHLEEVLFNNTFDAQVTTTTLPTLVLAMTQESSLFRRILEHIVDVEYLPCDLQYFITSILHVKPRNLKLFFDKFGYIVEDLIENFQILNVVLKIAFDYGVEGLKPIIDLFLDSVHITDFIRCTIPSTPTISLLFEVLYNQDQCVTKEEFTQMIYVMLTHGLPVTSKDLDTIYNAFGHCDLFRILLHMDVEFLGGSVNSLAKLYYDPRAEIDNIDLTVGICGDLLNFFNAPTVKRIILLASEDRELVERAKNLSQVPLLLELSRNAARKYIVAKFDVRTSMHFNTVLDCLPIGEMNRAIIALEKPLY